jgi:hypothetical protein
MRCSPTAYSAIIMAAMNSELGGYAGRPPNAQPNPFESAMYGAGPGLIRTGLGAYGEKFLGSSSEFMQSNVCFILTQVSFIDNILKLDKLSLT